MNKIVNLRQSFKDAPQAIRNQLAIQFKPLIVKIVSQESKKLKTDWKTLESMAYEGFAIALNIYDPERSKMDFKSFAAYAMLNNIRNCSQIELHTVKLTAYMRDQVLAAGGTTFTTVSVDKFFASSGSGPVGYESNRIDKRMLEMKYGIYENAKFADGDPMELLKYQIDTHCKAVDVECFCKYYGLFGYEETPVYKIAKEMDVTSGRVSQRIKTVLKYIKTDELLMDSLKSMTEK